MIRMEIIANNTVEQDILDAIKETDPGLCYSRLGPVHGHGRQAPRQGDAVWPEENFLLILYCSEENARIYTRALKGIKKRFPREGIKLFLLPYDELDLS